MAAILFLLLFRRTRSNLILELVPVGSALHWSKVYGSGLMFADVPVDPCWVPLGPSWVPVDSIWVPQWIIIESEQECGTEQ